MESRQVVKMIMFAIVLIMKISFSTSSNNKYKNYTCEMRVQISAKLKKEVPCEIWTNLNPICRQDIHIAYTHHPPYVQWQGNKNESVKGILPAMLRKVFDVCCLGCTKLTFVGPFGFSKKFNLFNPGASIVMPVETSKKSSRFFSMDFVYFLEVPGVSFFMPILKHDASELTANLFQSVLSTWPLFVTALIMAVTAGIAIWLMDTWVNVDDFPRSFLKGPFEGLWWAFVSMTTVGYGDKAPKSYLARFFAIIWILLGITIFSMYTAAMTSALTEKVFTKKVSVSGKTIAVVNTSAAAYSGALKETAVIKGYGSIDEIINATKRGEVDGVGLDDNIANFYSEKLKNNFKGYDFVTRVPITGIGYGIVMRDKNFNLPEGSFKHFFSTFFENNEDQREAIIAGAMSEIQKIQTIEPGSEDISVFSYKSPLFIVTLLSLLGIATVLLIAGFVIQYYQRGKNTNQEGKSDEEVQLVRTEFDAMEIDFLDEAKELCKRWREKYERSTNEPVKTL